MKKQIYILLILIPLINFSQENKLDSLYRKINSTAVFGEKEFKTVSIFHEYYLKKVIKKPVYNNKYDSIYIKALTWATLNKDKNTIFKAKHQLMVYYFRTDKKKDFVKIALQLIKNKDFQKTEDIISTLNLLANYYKETEQLSELLNILPSLYKYTEKYRKDDYRIQEGPKNNELGIIYFRLKDFKKSREYFFQAKNKYHKTKEYFQESSSLNNIGLTFLNENKLDSAQYYFDLGLKTLHLNTKMDKKNVDAFKAVIKGNIASIWLKKGFYDKAIPYYLNELRLNKKEILDINTIRSAYLKLGKAYFLKNEIPTALQYLDSTKNILKIYPNNIIEKAYIDLKGKCLLANGNIKEANTYFDILKKYNDSIKRMRFEQKNFLATVKYDTEKKEKELFLSKQKIELQKTKNKYQTLGIIFLLMVLTALFLFIKRLLKNQKRITKQKKQIQHSLEEKEILLKEVHHRVKNNLQIIASILELQNAKLDNKELNDILEQGQNRIQSMALIHQQLYQSKNLSDVAIEKYLKTLINHIAILNNNSNIKFNIKANHLKFNINTAIPLGLIINELITNIYKHAFKNNDKGEVFIEIKQKKEHLYELIFKDTGKGFPEDFDFNTTDSLGLKLIKILTQQLKGTVTIKENATFIIEFRDDATI